MATYTAQQDICAKCKAGLVNIVSGAVCPKGCEGVHPMLSAEVNRANVRAYRVSQLPKARKLRCMVATRKGDYLGKDAYAIIGYGGIYRRVRRTSSTLDQASQDNAVLAQESGAAIELMLWDKCIADMKSAMMVSDPFCDEEDDSA